MELPSLFIGILLFVAAIAYISLPFRQKQLADTSKRTTGIQANGRREAVLSALRDLDFDFKIGKISEEDYQPVRAQLLGEAADWIEAQEKEEEQLEALIQTRRAGRRQDVKCQDCGASMRADQHFCSKCGSAARSETCSSCGKNIQPGDLFCSSCGTKLEVRLETAAQS